MGSRQGLNKKTRHIAVHYSCLQERAQQGDFELEKIDGKKNPADLGTKHLARETMDKCFSKMGLEMEEGMRPLAPKTQ